MILYKYDNETKEYIGCFEAYIDPLESVKQEKPIYVFPPCTTLVEPFVPRVGYSVVFDGENWKEIEDYRGLMVWKNSELIMINKLGPLPSDCTLERVYSLKELKELKLKEIKEKYKNAYEEKVELNRMRVNIEDSVKLKDLLETFKEFGEFVFEEELVKVEEAQEVLKKLHERSINLLNIKKRLEEKVKLLKSKEEVEELKVKY